MNRLRNTHGKGVVLPFPKPRGGRGPSGAPAPASPAVLVRLPPPRPRVVRAEETGPGGETEMFARLLVAVGRLSPSDARGLLSIVETLGAGDMGGGAS